MINPMLHRGIVQPMINQIAVHPFIMLPVGLIGQKNGDFQDQEIFMVIVTPVKIALDMFILFIPQTDKNQVIADHIKDQHSE